MIYAVTIEQVRRKIVYVTADTPAQAADRGRGTGFRLGRDTAWKWDRKRARFVHDVLEDGRFGTRVEVVES